MTKNISKLALMMTLGSGLALAQGMGQQSPQTPPTVPPSSTSPAPDASQPSAHPDTQAPSSTSPTTDQSGKAPVAAPDTTAKPADSAKLPQSDAAAGTSTNDVQSTIQSALQQDSTLASANITAKVTDKNVELTGTVPSKDAKDQAEKIVKTNAGDRKIKNHLKIATADKSMDKSGVQKDNTSTNPKK
jgi:hypothetical protein